MKLKTFSNRKQTLGCLSIGDLELFTLELPWLDNQQNISCISAGKYKVTHHVSPTHGKCLKIQDVENRTHILFHVANFIKQLKGCIAPGLSMADMNQDGLIDVTSSRVALNRLMKAVPPEGCELEIVRAL